ncbi:MAG: hypothetical protein P4L99_13250 [Chthoniobacter sp.]|nr:hypothetical protein [Chthoniobacter sp.]
MNRSPYRRLLFLVAGLAILTLAGCATLRPISSKPPRDKIVLPAPVTSTGWAGILPPIKYSVILPAGEYRPLYEDDQYYYYQAPSKVVVNDLTSLMFDGGIYVARGTTTPRGWYYVDEDGSQSFGKFETPPRTR